MVSRGWAAPLCELALSSVPQRPPRAPSPPPAGLRVPGHSSPSGHNCLLLPSQLWRSLRKVAELSLMPQSPCQYHHIALPCYTIVLDFPHVPAVGFPPITSRCLYQSTYPGVRMPLRGLETRDGWA